MFQPPCPRTTPPPMRDSEYRFPSFRDSARWIDTGCRRLLCPGDTGGCEPPLPRPPWAVRAGCRLGELRGRRLVASAELTEMRQKATLGSRAADVLSCCHPRVTRSEWLCGSNEFSPARPRRQNPRLIQCSVAASADAVLCCELPCESRGLGSTQTRTELVRLMPSAVARAADAASPGPADP